MLFPKGGKELQFELDADGVIVCDQAYEKKTTPKWRYDLGRKKNFEQVGSLQWINTFLIFSWIYLLNSTDILHCESKF